MRVRAVVVALFVVAIGIAGSYSVTRPKPLEREPLVPTVPPRTVMARLMTVQAHYNAFRVGHAYEGASGAHCAADHCRGAALHGPADRNTYRVGHAYAEPSTAHGIVHRHVCAGHEHPSAFDHRDAYLGSTASIGHPHRLTCRRARAATSWTVPSSDRARIGVGAGAQGIDGFDWGDTPPGWYLNWSHTVRPGQWPQVPFVRMVHPNGDKFSPDLETITRTAAANPGALWLIGNEPDIAWQDNSTPEQYAHTYGILNAAIKKADPTARVAIGGVSQPTPLRLAYLDRVLAAYKAQYGTDMPVDVWNIHAFILREERNSWGVGIPPGMNVDNKGTLREIDDHADMAIFKQQIVDFRRWMAERGQRDKPLLVSEYSILMPEDYGFSSDVVSKFMKESFDYLLTAKDAALGYSADGNRLVQAFCWFSTADKIYPTSNLFDPETRAITPVGKAFKEYMARLK